MKRILKNIGRLARAYVAVFYAACQCVVHVLLVVLRVALAYVAVFVLACRCIGPCLFALRVGLNLKKSGVIQ